MILYIIYLLLPIWDFPFLTDHGCRILTAVPKIDYDKKLDSTQTVKAGSLLILQVNVSGSPKPAVSWMLNGKPADVCRNVTIESTPDSSKLTAKGSNPTNAGKYTVTAQNEAGVGSADFTVVVIGKFIWPWIWNTQLFT